MTWFVNQIIMQGHLLISIIRPRENLSVRMRVREAAKKVLFLIGPIKKVPFFLVVGP